MNTSDSSLEPVDLNRVRVRYLLLFIAAILASCALGLWILGQARLLPQSGDICWVCGETATVLAVLGLLSLIQLCAAALLPALPFSALLEKGRLWLLLRISVVASMVNAFAPAKAGVGLKAVMFKKYFGIRYMDFAAAHLLASAISLLVCMTVIAATYGRLALDTVGTEIGKFHSYTGWVAIVATGSLVVAMVCWMKFGAAVRQAFRRGIEFLLRRRTVAAIVGMVLVAALQVALVGGRAMLAAYLFGAAPAWQTVMVFGAILSLAPLVSFIPGGLGIRESIFVLAGVVTGIPATISLAAALIDRLAGTAIIAVLGLLGLRGLWVQSTSR